MVGRLTLAWWANLVHGSHFERVDLTIVISGNRRDDYEEEYNLWNITTITIESSHICDQTLLIAIFIIFLYTSIAIFFLIITLLILLVIIVC